MRFWLLPALLIGCGGGPADHDHGDHAHHDHGDHAKKGHSEHAEHAEKHANHGKHDGHEGHDTKHHRFDDPEKWAEVFDDPERNAWQQPAKVVAALDLSPGMTVADVGAGTGYFNPHLAAAVGPEGQVIALDLEQSMVDYMTERATRDGTPQVEARTVAGDDPGLAAASVDRILVNNTWHHLPGRTAYAGKLAAALKPGGKLVVVDFSKASEKGPPKKERLTPSEVTAEVTPAGFTLAQQVDLPDQYVLVYTSGS